MNTLRGKLNSLVVDSPLQSNLTYLWKSGLILGLALVLKIGKGVLRLWESWNNSILRKVVRDSEGDLLPESYKERRKRRLGGYYLMLMSILILLSKWVVRLGTKYSFIVLPWFLVLLSTIIILYMESILLKELTVMVRTYRDKKRRGVYDVRSTSKRGIFGGGGGRADLYRIWLRGLRAIGGGILGTAGMLEAANTIGKGLGYGEVGTRILENAARGVGIHRGNVETMNGRERSDESSERNNK